MKKFIALILVLVMVLSLSTVAFAEYERRNTLLKDTVNGVLSVVNRVSNVFGFKGPGRTDLRFNNKNAYGHLANTVIRYHDSVIGNVIREGEKRYSGSGIAGAIAQMGNYVAGRIADHYYHGTKNAISDRIQACGINLGQAFSYVYSITGVMPR